MNLHLLLKLCVLWGHVTDDTKVSAFKNSERQVGSFTQIVRGMLRTMDFCVMQIENEWARWEPGLVLIDKIFS